jgi:aryl-alcohol dehydrogenase (NADP+)
LTHGVPRRRLGRTDLQVFPLCLGCNVFGWTANRDATFAVLDRYAEAGGNFIDTADLYPPGGVPGESERMIGEWLSSRGTRSEMVIATKVGQFPGLQGLSEKNVQKAVENSLQRLQIDYVDLLHAHADDRYTPLEESLGVFTRLVESGVVRYIAASNFRPRRLDLALRAAEELGCAKFAVLATHYSLLEREDYERNFRSLCEDRGLACVPYWGLEQGFLTGKYSGSSASVDSPKAGGARANLFDPRSGPLLQALARIAADHDASMSAVALSWLARQRTVTAPVASARTPEQLEDLLEVAHLDLSSTELRTLADLSEGA